MSEVQKSPDYFTKLEQGKGLTRKEVLNKCDQYQLTVAEN